MALFHRQHWCSMNLLRQCVWKPLIGRWATTYPPLSSVFNTKPRDSFANRFTKPTTGLFCLPELHDCAGFHLLEDKASLTAGALVQEALDPNRKRKLVTIFDELSDTLCKVADLADFVCVAHPEESFSQAAETSCVNISGLVEQLNTNVEIHGALSSVIERGDHFLCDEVDKRVAELFMFDFQQSGIHLPDHTRRQFVSLNEDIMRVGTDFQQGTHQRIQVPKTSVPEQLSHTFALEGDNVCVTGLFSDHPSDMVREAAYKLYLYPNPHQLQLLTSLLNKRRQLANLVGFPTYAHRALRGTLAESPENVTDFLESLAEKLRPRADSDYTELGKVKAQNTASSEVFPWDTTYYAALARNQRCEVDTSCLSAYFSLGACMEGLRLVFTSLYGVDLVAEEPQTGELWHKDVYKLAVVHESEGILGHIYCDPFERYGKARQDCHFTIRGGRQVDEQVYQAPVVVLMLSLPAPRGRCPSLLTPDMVENLFHEFGHAMHSMLGRTRYQHVTGTRCPTDFAEVPSILMEYFATDPRVVSQFARHYQTGEVLSEEKIQSMYEAKRLFSASDLQTQVFYAMLDQVYHGPELNRSTTEVIEEVQNQYHSLKYVPNTAWHLRFGHFVGYGAKYYSYLMSRAVASKVWQQCFLQDPFSRSMGEQYRTKMLVHGGGVHPRDLVKDMLNETPTSDVLVGALMDDLDT